ncbi:hypothetical protein LAUMK35_05287 [Mycobacterium pseudokansasii]|uniref:Secreted protein n=2 Tax=Mycobacterium pseudokansasii TaxID=2341080 RepID=A0A498QYX2_9MYCO|nr:hypothetical protein [Mycobacterium pseudokansasii]KZS64076.1 hypothetical protein A4G27_11255 [Mycobacterium kansasii]VBA32621.1 hypothetical protein LAUMK35_05287 [Mycobacterium pseudokansasii]VBA34300.1 hypothetical protein LAUMK21_05245 [Mycobacterium pseudokansasii]VBA55730.1 hypothetical protein LAUMK142_05223 [Mycobacterium pseudokansasii]
MKRLVSGAPMVAVIAGLLLAVAPAPYSPAASNTATTLFPIDDATQLETHTFVNCHPNGSCDFVAGADLRTPDGVTGFPSDLWARQTTEIRPTNRLTYLDAHATGQFERVMKAGGSDVITTVYFGDGPPDKYQTTGVIDSTSWSTGQPSTNAGVIVCTHIQVVYSGVNLTSPSTCAQTNFS